MLDLKSSSLHDGSLMLRQILSLTDDKPPVETPSICGRFTKEHTYLTLLVMSAMVKNGRRACCGTNS